METLDIPILPWTARINVEGVDLGGRRIIKKKNFYEFRSIVASDICQRSMSLHQQIKLIEHVCGSNTPSHMNQMTFPSVLIDYREHFQPPAPHSSVVNKVPAPHMAAIWVAWVGSPVDRPFLRPRGLCPGKRRSSSRRIRCTCLLPTDHPSFFNNRVIFTYPHLRFFSE
jgi:hypothetical protein